ncbi:MAG: Eco57I restriction-modification methylase domain-containing protein [Bacteroidales bacterium]|jgi:adenine-specific DNA-methyltransferase|nr:Eco57I restriction-modification methylase domain-containing protein [Bacteroidales bacterium]
MTSNSFINTAYKKTTDFVESIPKSERKKYGQFFTSEPIAEYMATLFNFDCQQQSLRLLDAGAGTGLLTVALVENLRKSGYKGEITAVCYENDPKVIPTLVENLETLKKTYSINYVLTKENYLTSQNFIELDLFKGTSTKYDMIIGNPPYLKVSKDSPEVKALSEVCYGAPNLYFLFWAMGIHNLKDDGELVYVIPRSWTSGAYFERFRKFLFKHCVITNIHIFKSRDKVFENDSVLQETMIIKIRKSQVKPEFITVSSSSSCDFSDIKFYYADYDTIVSQNQYVFIVTDKEEAEILSRINRQKYTLEENDLRMKTGLIVDFREQEILRNNEEDGTYPLFYSQHIKDGRVLWPVGREGEYIMTDRIGFLQENSDYLFVKRFTSKEEKRRLQCGIYLNDEHKQYKYISTQNKINFIKCDNPEIAYGLFTILNSSLYDSYYRILNGSTQVNSTEINAMPVPSKNDLELIGKELIGQELTEQNCNNIVDKWIK